MLFIFSPQIFFFSIFYFFVEAVSTWLFLHRRGRCQFFSTVHDDGEDEAATESQSLVFDNNFVLTLSTSCFRYYYYYALPTDPKSTCNRDRPEKWLPTLRRRTASKTAFCYCFCSSPSRCTKMAKLNNDNEDWRGRFSFDCFPFRLSIFLSF